MAKKKNSPKKHTFKHSSVREAAPVAQGVAAETNPVKPVSRPAAASSVTARDFGYVTDDLKRIGIAAAALVALELILFYVLTQTPVGATIYNLVKV